MAAFHFPAKHTSSFGMNYMRHPENVERWRKAEIERLERQSLLLERLARPKPRLSLKHHVWSCRTGTHLVDMCIGYGYTARDAYDDWRQRWTRTNR